MEKRMQKNICQIWEMPGLEIKTGWSKER